MLEYCSPKGMTVRNCSLLRFLESFTSVSYGGARTIYVGAENPAIALSFTECQSPSHQRLTLDYAPDCFIEYDGGSELQVHSSLVNIVLHD
jgi:hypothetical protein